MNTFQRTLTAALPLAVLLTLLAGSPLPIAQAQAQAQAQTSAATRDTETLRRMQRNLQQAQQERDTAQAEKAALQRERETEAGQQKQAQARLANLQRDAQAERSQLQAVQAQVASLEQQLQAAQKAQQDAGQASTTAQAAWARERQALRQDLDGRTQTNLALVAQLAIARTALEEARRNNQALHAMGLELLDLYRQAPDGAQWQRGEQLLGLAGVRLEERAEKARTQLDAALVGRTKTGSAAPGQP